MVFHRFVELGVTWVMVGVRMVNLKMVDDGGFQDSDMRLLEEFGMVPEWIPR